MTSEVVVMNRLGVALASDSAATVSIFGNQRAKVYHADKLFMLSNAYPVGAMVYNNSAMLGIPWETIFKMFRRQLGSQPLPHLEDYAQRLITFLCTSPILFPQVSQDHFFKQMFAEYLHGIGDAVRDKCDSGSPPADIAAEFIQREIEDWQKKPNASCFSDGRKLGAEVVGRLSGEVSTIIDAEFRDLKLGSKPKLQLFDLARMLVNKDDILHEVKSGLVVAGFGDQDVLPVMEHYAVGGVYEGQLKYTHIETKRVTHEQGAIVEPFAESDMLQCFFEGISPRLKRVIMNRVASLALALPSVVVDNAPELARAKRERLKQDAESAATALVKSWWDSLNEDLDTNREPILSTIAFLPKDELAHVAASLVNLNSFQKRMAIDEDETVGGPIDVAVISKGDGFVWIKRKHYFEPQLNPHFFRNYGAPASQPPGSADAASETPPNSQSNVNRRRQASRRGPRR